MFIKLMFVIVLTGIVGMFAGCATSEYAKSDYEKRGPSQSGGHRHH